MVQQQQMSSPDGGAVGAKSSHASVGKKMSLKNSIGRNMSAAGSVRSTGSLNVFSIFPLDICCCFPGMAGICFPKNMAKIQDWTHLAMVFGVLSGFSMLILCGYEIFWRVAFSMFNGTDISNTCFNAGGYYCAGEGLAFMVLPSIFYWYGLVQQYDEDILRKRLQLEELQEQNQQLLADTIEDMEGVLANQVENNSGLAERSFDAKKRDFLRFVRAAKQKYQHYFAGSKAEETQLTQEFRQFVKQWLIIFEEASVDPVNHPIMLAGENQVELDSLSTLTDIADWVMQKLGATKVNFISEAMKDSQQTIANTKAEERRIRNHLIEAKFGIMMAKGNIQEGSVLRVCFDEWRSLTKLALRIRAKGNARDVALLEEGNLGWGKRHSITEEDAVEEDDERQPCFDCTWWRCSRNRIEVDQRDQGAAYPCVLYIGCASIILLTKEHTYMMMGVIAIVIGSVLVALQADWLSLVLYLFLLIAIIAVLTKFEFIDEVLRLQSEVEDLKERAQEVEAKSKRMKAFWEDVQNITDLWLHRTVPRLEVVKEAHGHLEDAKPEELIGLLSRTNKALQNLEKSVGPRQLWLANGGITLDEKKRFGEQIYGLSNNKSLPAVLEGLSTAQVMITNISKRASLNSSDRAMSFMNP